MNNDIIKSNITDKKEKKINYGKIFEEDFSNSFPGFLYRLKDGGGWSNGTNTRFTVKNMCDYVGYYKGFMYCLELKSTKQKSLPIINIKRHQIAELYNASQYEGVKCYFIINYRELNKTYALSVEKVKELYENEEVNSISYKKCEEIGTELEMELKRIRHRYNVKKLLEEESV